MQKLVFVLLLTFLVVGCKKNIGDEQSQIENHEVPGTGVSEYRNAFVFKYTSVGCGTCGYVGDILHHQQVNKGSANVILINLHSGDQMEPENDPYKLEYSFPSGGVLGQFHVGNDMADLLMDYSDMGNWVDSKVDITLSDNADITVESAFSVNGNTVTTDILLKVNQTHVFDNYVVGAYLLEDGIESFQNGGASGGGAYIHNDVYRIDMVEYGQGIASSNSLWDAFIDVESFNATGNSYTKDVDVVLPSLSLEIDPSWESENLKVVVVLLESEGFWDDLNYINACYSERY